MIRMDSLPQTRALGGDDDYMEWSDVEAIPVETCVLGEGLLVKIDTNRDK